MQWCLKEDMLNLQKDEWLESLIGGGSELSKQLLEPQQLLEPHQLLGPTKTEVGTKTEVETTSSTATDVAKTKNSQTSFSQETSLNPKLKSIESLRNKQKLSLPEWYPGELRIIRKPKEKVSEDEFDELKNE